MDRRSKRTIMNGSDRRTAPPACSTKRSTFRSTSRARATGFVGTLVWLLLLPSVLFIEPVFAADLDRLNAARLEDAELTAVAFLDVLRGWAVGDRGAIWQTTDGGRNWRAQESPVECRWEDVTFVDEQNGWAAGGRVEPGTFKTTGVLLRTRDGGQNWMQLPTPTLPGFRRIVFRDERRGWAITASSAMYPSGLLETDDGGRSWNPLPVKGGGDWTAGDFLQRSVVSSGAAEENAASGGRSGSRRSRLGVAASADGRLAALLPGELVEATSPGLAQRRARQVRLSESGAGWLTGDEGLVLVTADGGLNWRAPAGALPSAVTRCDFTALATVGSHCWIAGAPGSWVLRSTDGGATWELFATGQTLPLQTLHFVDEQHGWAVGALGAVLATRDGGRTWRRQHGGQRLALLAVLSEPEATPFELFAQLCGNDGYRGGAAALFRRDVETGDPHESTAEQRFQAAVTAAGGSAAVWSTRFPVRQRGLPLSADSHRAAWGDAATSDERLTESIAQQIRQWRPDVIVTDDPDAAHDPELARLAQHAVLAAADRAARSGAGVDGPPGLGAWQVKKIYSCLPGSDRGTIRLSTSQLAARLGRTLGDAALVSRETIGDGLGEASPAQFSFRLLVSHLPQDTGRREFFGGLSIPPDSEARRGATGLGKADLATLQRSAQQQRNVQQLLLRSGDTARSAAWLAQFDELTRGLPPDGAGDVAWQLARRYEQSGRHELAIATCALIAQRYPQHRWCDPALVELLRLQSSGELAYWRRASGSSNELAAATDDFAADSPVDNSLDPAASTSSPPSTGSPAPFGSFGVGTSGAGGAPGRLPVFVELPTPPPIRRPSRLVAATKLAFPDDAEAPQPATPQRRISATDAVSPADVVRKAGAFDPLGEDAPPDAAASASDATDLRPDSKSGADGPADEQVDERIDAEAVRDRTLAQFGEWLERSRPWLFAEPRVKAALAGSSVRQARDHDVRQWWRLLAAQSRRDGWPQIARQELQRLERTERPGRARPAGDDAEAADELRRARCAVAGSPPVLDGRLDEACWTAARPLFLNSRLSDDAPWPAVALLARDDEHLYLAVQCRAPGMTADDRPATPRPRDPDQRDQDRVEFYLDVDRDYATAFQLTVDSRGWVAERCAGDSRWNPNWYVAAKREAGGWTVEAAVPWRELTANPPRPGDAWALGVQRIAPQLGFQSWTAPAAVVVRPDGWGLLTFE